MVWPLYGFSELVKPSQIASSPHFCQNQTAYIKAYVRPVEPQEPITQQPRGTPCFLFLSPAFCFPFMCFLVSPALEASRLRASSPRLSCIYIHLYANDSKCLSPSLCLRLWKLPGTSPAPGSLLHPLEVSPDLSQNRRNSKAHPKPIYKPSLPALWVRCYSVIICPFSAFISSCIDL